MNSGDNPLNKATYSEEEHRVRNIVTNFVVTSVNIANLDHENNLFESGVVNSLFAVQLVTFLEKTFAIEIGMDDLDIENFKSLNATTAFVMRKNGWQSAGGLQ